MNPLLAKEWHPIKNGDLTADDVSLGSDKKVWWKCDKGDDHVWEARVHHRVNGIGCPICSNRKIVISNCLATLKPKLAKHFKSLIVLISFYLTFLSYKKNNKKRDALLEEIKFLKENKVNAILDSNKFELSKQKIDSHLNRVLNETDWRVLLILLDNPMVLNKEIAEKSNMSIDGIGSSLRRMYDYFEINQTKYKKVALIHKAVNISERI